MKQHILARLIIIFTLACLCAIGGASAAYAQVVAFGASITRGKGVSGQEAYPARLEALLRSKGINVTVVNQGINGDTLQNMQDRMDRAVPQGTRVVILQVGAPKEESSYHCPWYQKNPRNVRRPDSKGRDTPDSRRAGSSRRLAVAAGDECSQIESLKSCLSSQLPAQSCASGRWARRVHHSSEQAGSAEGRLSSRIADKTLPVA